MLWRFSKVDLEGCLEGLEGGLEGLEGLEGGGA